MTFFDKIERLGTDVVYTIVKISRVSDNDGYELVRELPQTDREGFFKTTVGCLELGDPIFTSDYQYITHRNA